VEDRPNLSVVIPAWNERENLEVLLPMLQETLRAIDVRAEILVVDGGSTDGTRPVVEAHGARYVLQTERGYGGALLAGFAEARADYIATMDADLSHPPSFLKAFWSRRNEATMLIGSRYVPGGKAEMNWFRRLLSFILNRTFALALAIPVKDMSSGFRMYHREALQNLKLESRDFDALEEILIQIHGQGCRILEVPFHYQPRGSGSSHARLFKFGLAYVKLLLRVRRPKPVSR
jgi:dolichol-phosphate mannosyltransferase